jgi:hypothetical protein
MKTLPHERRRILDPQIMKRTLDSTSEPCLRASGNGDSIPGLVKAGESSPSRCATPRARDAMNREVTAMMDSGIAIAGRKKPRLAPEEGVSQPNEETIPIASSKDGTKGAKHVPLRWPICP